MIQANCPRSTAVIALFISSLGVPLADAAPYQRTLTGGACPSGAIRSCKVTFPRVPAARQLAIEFISCSLRSSNLLNAGSLLASRLSLRTQEGATQVVLPLQTSGATLVRATDAIHSIVSMPVRFVIPAEQQLEVVAEVSAGVPTNLSCTIVGDLN